MTSPEPVLFSASQVLISGIKELRLPANRNDTRVLHLVRIQRRRDSDDATQEPIGPSCEIIASKFKYFN